MKLLTIGQVARRVGISVETVRFYEREGLLHKPARKLSGYRQYTAEVIRVLQFIQRAKRLGFTLKEVKGFLHLQQEPIETRADVKQVAAAKVIDIQSRINSLERLKAALYVLVERCDSVGPLADCPIIEALTHVTAEIDPNDAVGHAEKDQEHEPD